MLKNDAHPGKIEDSLLKLLTRWSAFICFAANCRDSLNYEGIILSKKVTRRFHDRANVRYFYAYFG